MAAKVAVKSTTPRAPRKTASRSTAPVAVSTKKSFSTELKILIALLIVVILALLVVLLVLTSFSLTDDSGTVTYTPMGQHPAATAPAQTSEMRQAVLLPSDGKSSATGDASMKQTGEHTALSVSATNLPKPTASQAYAVYLVGTPKSKTEKVFIGRIMPDSNTTGTGYSLEGTGPASWYAATGIEIDLQNTVNPKRAQIQTIFGQFQ